MAHGVRRRRLGRAVRCALPLALLAGCISRARYFDVGVELAPDAAGWRDNLSVEPPSIPVQFQWRDGPVSVEIANWPHDATYFMVYVDNSSAEPVRMLVHGVTPGWAAHGQYDVFPGPGSNATASGRLSEGVWIELPARGMIEFWIDDLGWGSGPSVGDRIDASIDFERGGTTVTCPLRFHVARVFRGR